MAKFSKRRGPRKIRKVGRARKSIGLKRKGYVNNLSRAVGPVARRTILKMKYNDIFSVASGGGGVPGFYLFNLNSVFDPDRTGTGHQPYGHDTYQTLYQRYRVFACSWNIELCNTTGEAWQVTVLPHNDVTTIAPISLAAEMPYAISKVVQSGTAVARFHGRMNLPKLNGSTPAAYKSDDRFQAIAGNSPVENMALHIYWKALNGGVLSYTATFRITLNYMTEWFDPVDLAQS